MKPRPGPSSGPPPEVRRDARTSGTTSRRTFAKQTAPKFSKALGVPGAGAVDHADTRAERPSHFHNLRAREEDLAMAGQVGSARGRPSCQGAGREWTWLRAESWQARCRLTEVKRQRSVQGYWRHGIQGASHKNTNNKASDKRRGRGGQGSKGRSRQKTQKSNKKKEKKPPPLGATKQKQPNKQQKKKKKNKKEQTKHT